MCNEELHVLYCSPKIFRVKKMGKIEMGGAFSAYGERRSVFRVLKGKRDGKRQPVRHRRRWDNNIKMDFQEVGCGGMDCIKLAENSDSWRAFVNAVMSLWVP